MKILNIYKEYKRPFWLILGVLLVAGIYYFQNYNPPVVMDIGAYAEEKSMAFDSLVAPTERYAEEAKVIKTGSLNLHVDDVRAKAAEIQSYAEGLAGYVGDASINKGDTSYNASMTLRVPTDKFEGAMTYLQGLAVYVNSVYVNANDVTEYYQDLDAKIGNRKALEQQYLEILKSATEVDAIVSITTALANVRSEIEILEIEKKGYDNQITYSTISLYLEEDASAGGASEKWSPKTTYKQALSDWVVFLQSVVDAGIYAAVNGWPLLLFYVLYRIIRRKK
ncbi:DUF4349 domain-containing protein [Candidatus Peregrinibacteria bacterium]|nr:DUF4349 domain-containing protein [Candidatus Peregrinibacteria bacterium]